MQTRGTAEPDLDADGLSPQLESQVGTSPLVADSDGTPDHLEDFDQDGLRNSEELLGGTDAAQADTDGDGIVDSRDARPTTFDGERAVWVHTDHLGSVSVLSDETGAVLRRITYGVWGEVRTNVPTPGMASLDSAEKYTGQRYDEETTLYYYGARYYDAGLGRFIGADAVIASQYRTSALQPYAYVESNPLNNVDPSGNFAVPGPSSGGGGGYGWNRPDRNTRNPVADLLGLLQDAIDREFPNGWLAFQGGNPAPAQSEPRGPVQPEQTPQAQMLVESQRRTLLATYAEGLASAAQRGDVTSLEALALVADYGAALTSDPGTFIDDIGQTLSATTRDTVGSPSGRVPPFGSTGFRSEFRDQSNQVRHFTGALVAGARYGTAVGQALNTGREIVTERNFADIRMGNRAAALGAGIMGGGISLSSVGAFIRREF